MNDGITALNPAQVAVQEKQAAGEGYVQRLLDEVDVLGNVITGGLPDETISSRLGRDAEKHEIAGELGSKILDDIQPDHVVKAQAGDTERADAVVAVEENAGELE